MRVLFATWAAPSHLFPMVPLAWAFRAAGHEVRVAAPASGAAAVAATGLSAVAAGPDVAVAQMAGRERLAPWRSRGEWATGWSARPDLLGEAELDVLRALADKQLMVADAMLGDLVAFGRRWAPDLVVYDSLCLAGPVAAAALGVPAYGFVAGSPAVTRIERLHPSTGPLPAYLRLFERFGAEPVVEPRGWLDPCPPSLRLPFDGDRTELRHVSYNGPGTVPGWLLDDPGRPRVVVTGGAAGSKYGGQAGAGLFRDTLEAVTSLGAEAVLALTPAQAENLGPVPEGTRVVRSLPFHLLFPACHAVVHHGGSGTAFAAFAAGLPQLVLPQAPVLAELARSMEARGAALVLGADEQEDPRRFATAVARLLDDNDLTRAARNLQDEVATMPPPSALATTLTPA
ncbi:nucleotide disphospho-sugar-binding domain-containing protein [Streptomyces montanisoli]|uniref:DUF1205 domain-containing protein n=1 Tax=Streptomyces montanisoli TaxID=2798581 RepID=A0A940S0X1_9ACTN|nr:nucleotide disphospho-sugar-binding domain-containing protein [Streptomyces montanisoli]MBP0461349.1 DUF1205 domain-containing protein [Streptomyces montanisoli]